MQSRKEYRASEAENSVPFLSELFFSHNRANNPFEEYLLSVVSTGPTECSEIPVWLGYKKKLVWAG